MCVFTSFVTITLSFFLPGMYPNIVNKMFIQKSAPSPLSNKTPSGGRKMAKNTLQISDQVKGINFQIIFNHFLYLFIQNCKKFLNH